MSVTQKKFQQEAHLCIASFVPFSGVHVKDETKILLRGEITCFAPTNLLTGRVCFWAQHLRCCYCFHFFLQPKIFAVMTEKKSLQRHHITIGIFLNFPPSLKTYHYSFGIEIKISEDARIVWDDSERFGWREKQNKLRWNRKNFSSRFTEIFISELYHSRIMNILTYFYYLRQEIFYLDALFPLFLVPGRVKNQVLVSRDLQDWTQISAALLV